METKSPHTPWDAAGEAEGTGPRHGPAAESPARASSHSLGETHLQFLVPGYRLDLRVRTQPGSGFSSLSGQVWSAEGGPPGPERLQAWLAGPDGIVSLPVTRRGIFMAWEVPPGRVALEVFLEGAGHHRFGLGL